MLTYTFNSTNSKPLYEQLYSFIKTDILVHRLQAHEKLPSKRSLSKHLNLSLVTIENAYGQLMVEGYIYSVEKKGYFVAPISSPSSMSSSSSISSTSPHFSSKSLDIKQAPLIDLVRNQIDSTQFPFSIWAKLMREAISTYSDKLLNACPASGLLELRKAIATHLYAFRGMHVHPDQIVIGAGTEYLYSLIIQLLGRALIYAIEDPGYQKIAKIYKHNNVVCKPIPLDQSGLSVRKLSESNSNIVHISPAHHYPTGLVMPINRRYDLLSWSTQKPSRYILEDDYDCEFRFLGKPIPTLQSIDVMEKVIYINTFSKTLAPSFRISYMVLPPHLVEAFHQQLGFYTCTVSSLEQYTLAAFISRGFFEKHLNRMRVFYRNQRDQLLEAIKKSPLSSSTITEENSGLHFLMHVKTGLSDDEIVARAREHGLNLACLSHYFHHPENAQTGVLVINYSGLSPQNINLAIERLCAALS